MSTAACFVLPKLSCRGGGVLDLLVAQAVYDADEGIRRYVSTSDPY